MDINQELEALKAIEGGEFDLYVSGSKTSNTISNSSDFRAVIGGGQHRFTFGNAPSSVSIIFRRKKCEVFGMAIKEFDNCCGKLMGYGLRCSNMYYDSDHVRREFDVNILRTLMKMWMSILQKVVEYCKYTSITFIVSAKEQPLFKELIDEHKDFKIINEFKNERMSSKNLCIEYCKNFFGE